MQASPNSSGQYLVVDSPYEVARWRPLVNWILAIPHFAILYVFRAVAGVAGLIYWLGLIFTGRLIGGLYNVMAMYERYNARATGFLIGYSEQYAPFDFDGGGSDNGAYPPVRLELPEPPETTSRKHALNVFLAIPHYIVLAIFMIGAAFVAVAGWFAVLFTGSWPQGMRDFLVRVANYYHRVWTYVAMVEPTYPAFGLPAA